MSWILWDPDEWETVYEGEPADLSSKYPCGWASLSTRRRAPEDVARIKAEKRTAHEAAVLAEAAAIQARRSAETDPGYSK